MEVHVVKAFCQQLSYDARVQPVSSRLAPAIGIASIQMNMGFFYCSFDCSAERAPQALSRHKVSPGLLTSTQPAEPIVDVISVKTCCGWLGVAAHAKGALIPWAPASDSLAVSNDKTMINIGCSHLKKLACAFYAPPTSGANVQWLEDNVPACDFSSEFAKSPLLSQSTATSVGPKTACCSTPRILVNQPVGINRGISQIETGLSKKAQQTSNIIKAFHVACFANIDVYSSRA